MPPKKVAAKGTEGKAQLHLLPYDFVTEVARAMEFGTEKYGKHGYRAGVEWTEYIDATLRHMYAFADPAHDDLDEESKLSHLSHAAASIAMLVYLTKYKPKFDNRE